MFNDLPVITNVTGAVNYIEAKPAVVVASSALLTDTDSPNFDGGVLTVSLTSGGTVADVLSIRSQGVGNGRINLNGTNVTYEVGDMPIMIGTVWEAMPVLRSPSL